MTLNSDQTNPLLTAFTKALIHHGTYGKTQTVSLMYAKIFLRRTKEENGRRSLPQLQADSLRELTESFREQQEILHAMLIDPEQGFGSMNKDMRPLLNTADP
ncbi:MAG: hypothetical protein V4668_02910 [Patescibacteria group bacterium]